MKCFALRLFVICMPLLIGACTKADPNPHLKDPIYKDLSSRQGIHEKTRDEGREKLAELRVSLAKAEPNTLEIRDIERDIKRVQREIRESDQWARYYKIRAQRRVVVDRITYRRAFEAGEEWPDPSEYSDYLVNRRLVEIDRNWNARVPKLQNRVVNATKVPDNAEKTAASIED